MSHRKIALALSVALLLIASVSAHATVGTCDTAGPVEVEQPTPTAYATLGAAFAAINAGTHTGGALDIEICGNTDELAASAVLNASGAGSALYTSISIKPVGGVARTITGATTAGSPLIDLNGADGVTIDGVNAGGDSLTIANTTASTTNGTSTIRFVGGATGNTVTRTAVQGSYNASASVTGNLGGTIFFSTDASTANGNDTNTISDCEIGPAGANLPTRAIFSTGSTTTTAIGNSGNIIDNNRIFDFFGGGVDSAGVNAFGGTNTWTITNNRFYQTATRTFTGTFSNRPINIVSTTATSGAQGFTITGNIIGFATAGGTGTYTVTGSTGKFAGIVFSGITGGTLSTISSNTVAEVSLSGVTSNGTGTSSPFIGIMVINGLADTNSNIIGSQSTTGSLTFSTNTTTSTEVYGLFNFSLDNWTANSNNIGSITANNAGASGTFIVYLMRANTSTTKVFNADSNNVGGTVANSVQTNSVSTTSQIVGMATSNAICTHTLNTIRNLTAAGGTGITTSASLIGMSYGTTSVAHTVSRNIIHTLTNTNASAATTITGIQYTGSAGANLISRNFIHSFSAASSAAIQNGIQISGGTSTYQNNMIRLGINAAGGNETTGYVINGINEIGGTNNIHFNSVYVGGTGVGGSANTFGFNSTVTTNTRAYRDNIFFTARGNGAGTGKHYAVQVAGTAPNPAGLTINGNVYLASGTGGVFGRFNALDVAGLADWQTAVGQDTNSFSANPRYLLPTGTAATVNLHINPAIATVIEGNGIFIASVTDDFDADLRASFTPTDIGADAGNFMGNDLSPPVITYTPLPNSTNTTSRTLSTTITDASGVPVAGVGLPVIYFRKGTGGAYSSAQCSSTGGSGYDCVITFATVGGVVGGDTIQYYVAAQDSAATPNVTTNPLIGASGFTANPPAASTPPSTPSSFVVSILFSGTKTVCASGCDYATLTGGTGIFKSINDGELGGNLNIEIAGDLVVGEDGSVALNAPIENPPASNFTIKIYPTGSARLITSTTAPTGGFIRLNAADRITIDGSIGGVGSDRSLTITEANTGTATAVIWLQSVGSDGASSNTIKNVNVVGNSNTTTLIGIGAGSSTVSASSLGTNNNNNTYHNNSVIKTLFGIYSQGASIGTKNSGTVITQNSINAASPNNVQRGGIHIGFDNGALISQNTIGGMAGASADCFGIALGLTSLSTSSFTGNEVTNAMVTRNVIGPVVNTTTFSAAGITLASATSGTTQISNNAIHSVGANGTSPDFGVGILVGGGVGSTTQVYYNSVSLSGSFSTATTTPQPQYALGIGSGDPIVDVKNNALHAIVLFNGTSPAVGQVYAIGTASSTFVNLTSNNNDLFVATGAQYFVGRTGSLVQGSGTSHATLAAWQGATGDDAASISADPLFNSLTNLQPQLGSPLVGAGTPISVTIDITGGARSGSTPTIGAYETAAGDFNGPVITYTAFNNTLSTSNRTLSITATDPSGVPTAGVGLPVIYFRKGTGGAYASTQCTHTGGSGYNCVIDYSLVSGGSVTVGDLIQYYVVAQDNNNVVSVNPSAGASGLTANPPAAATPPTSPNSYFISQMISGSFNVGTGETFTSLTNPGGIFQHINNNLVVGDITINITSDLSGETGSVALNQWTEDGFAANYKVLIHPSGIARAVNGTGSGGVVIKLNGADRVTIDGSLSGGTDRSLTISNPNTATGTTVIWIGSLGIGAGANEVTVKNCIVQHGTVGSSTVTNFAFFVGDTTGAPNGADNDNLTLRNNHIRRTTIGIQAIGAVGGLNDNPVIAENLIGDPNNADSIGRIGMNVGQSTGASITQNTVQNVFTSDSAVNTLNNARGILLSAGLVSSSVTRNSVTNIRYTSTAGYGGKGIDIVTGNASSNLTIANNFVSDIKGDGWSSIDSDGTAGIRILSPAGGIKLYHNSVNLGSGSFAGNPTATISAALYAQTGVTGLDVRNNILATNLDSSTTPTSGAHKTYAIATTATTAALFTTIDNNDYYVNSLEGFVGLLNATDRLTLANWQTASGQDANSIAANPVFTTATDLHIDTIGGPSPVENEGVGLLAVTNDIDNDSRNATTPEIGADEVLACFAVVCSGFDTDCGLSSCDSAGLSGNCDILSPKDNGTICRMAAGDCDIAETCDGTNTGACPGDLLVAADTECRASAGDCDIAEACSGVSAACPTDAFEPDTTECRAAAGSPDCDTAEFCTGSGAACPPDTGDPNEAVGALTLDKTGSDADISWTEVEPGPFNVYRGSRSPGDAFVYNHGCFLQNEAGPTATDTTTPPAHVAFYYLVSRVQPPCTESSLGQDSDSNEIPNTSACPDPGEDFDGDSVIDYLDNCPADPNAGQLDTDGDSYGDVCDNCPAVSNPNQEDSDNDLTGNACE